MRVARVGDVLTAERGLQRPGHARLRHAEQRRLAAIDLHNQVPRPRFDAVIDVDDVVGGLEQVSQLAGDRLLPCVVGAVDFGDDRCLHRRARRYFDNLR